MLRLGNIKSKVVWEQAGITLMLSPLYDDKDKEFYDKCTEYIYHEGKMVDFKHDDVKYYELVGQECISSWEGVIDEKGGPVECTPDKVARFMKVPKASEFVMSHVKTLQLSLKKEEEDAKND